MPKVRGEFARRLGCLRIRLQHLDSHLLSHNLGGIETEARAVQDQLVDLLKFQRKLTKAEQGTLRRRFNSLREDALHSLENAQLVLDDSLEAMQCLVKSAQAFANSVADGKS